MQNSSRICTGIPATPKVSSTTSLRWLASGVSHKLQSSPRWIAAVRGWLASEHGPVYAFAAIWALGVLVPTIISVLLSVLGVRGVHVKWSLSLATYRELLESG